jgi:hypothetical protein
MDLAPFDLGSQVTELQAQNSVVTKRHVIGREHAPRFVNQVGGGLHVRMRGCTFERVFDLSTLLAPVRGGVVELSKDVRLTGAA